MSDSRTSASHLTLVNLVDSLHPCERWCRRRCSGACIPTRHTLGLGQRDKSSAKRSWAPQGPRESGEAAPARLVLAPLQRRLHPTVNRMALWHCNPVPCTVVAVNPYDTVVNPADSLWIHHSESHGFTTTVGRRRCPIPAPPHICSVHAI
jgi:hypothetical protein